MGCVHSSADISRPNLFQRNLCVHHKMPATEVYDVLGELGKGAFGVVEHVQHRKTKKHFAMKTVTFASGSKRSEFEKEMDILRGLHHPNIVRMIETFEDDHHFYIIMELCGGTLLEKVKERGSEFPEDVVKDIIANLASVIQYLHSRFICWADFLMAIDQHRDLKLENILIESEDKGGVIKLCDFGASTLFRMGVPMRKILGSVVYMAPEVLNGNYTNSCDLWSLGIIMYMLLSNKTPFHGCDEEELIDKIYEAKVLFDDPVWESVSVEAKSLIKKLLNPDPTTRYTATQLLSHPWIKSNVQTIPPAVYDQFIPRVKAFCQYSAFQRAALVALAFCISSAKIRQHSAVYNELNVAHNGILTLQELQQAPSLKRFSLDVEKIYQALDQQHEKVVNLLEFVAATLSPEDVSNEALLKRAFSIFDRENTGSITHHELLALLGQHFDLPACQEMVRRADADKDGKVGFDDFAKMMKLPARLAHGNRVCRRGSTTPTGKNSRSSPFKTQKRASMVTRSCSLAKLDTNESKPQVEKRRSSTPQHEISDALAELRAETERQEQVAAEIACETRDQAVKRIQSICLDLANASCKQVSHTASTKMEDINLSLESRPAEPTTEVASDPIAHIEVEG